MNIESVILIRLLSVPLGVPVGQQLSTATIFYSSHPFTQESSSHRNSRVMAATSADHLRREIQVILRDADLNTLSSKKVRLILEGHFKCDFTERKKEIDDILMSEITARDVLAIPAARTSEQVDQRRVERTDADRSSSFGQTSRPSQESVIDPSDQQITESGDAIATKIHQQDHHPSLQRIAVLDRILLERSSSFLCKESNEHRTNEETLRSTTDNRTTANLVQQRIRFE